MNTQQLALDFQNLLVKILPEAIKEVIEEGFPSKELSREKLEKAIKEAVEFHGGAQFFNVKKEVDNEELDKTVTHILSNPEEFKRYLKDKIVSA